MLCSVKNEDHLVDLEGLADLQSKLKQVRLEEKLRKQGFHSDAIELVQPITKTVADTNKELIKMTQSTATAIEASSQTTI